MADLPEESSTPTEVPLEVTEETPKPKLERTDAQKAALQKAREKAMAVRAENATLKKKEVEVERALLAKAKAERAAKVEAEYNALATVTEEASEEAPREKPRKRKPARRVIVTEASSASETEDEVEVILPRARKQPSAEETSYQRVVNKMFAFG